MKGEPHVEQRSLEETLEAARAADQTTRVIDWRGKVAAFGFEAVGALTALLPDRTLGMLAIAGMEIIARQGRPAERKSIIRSLAGALELVPPANRGYLKDVVKRLGGGVTGVSVVGGGPIYHMLRDYIEENPTEFSDLYLHECGTLNSGGYVRDNGGVLDSAGLQICLHCQAAVTKPHGRTHKGAVSFEKFESRTWVERNRWHEVYGWAQGDKVGDVYITRCYRWFTTPDRDVIRGKLYGEVDACIECAEQVDLAGHATPDTVAARAAGVVEQ